MAKVYRAKVTLAPGETIGGKDRGGEVVEVTYLTSSDQPTQAAIQAAAKKLGVPSLSLAPTVQHSRDGDGIEEPASDNA